MKTILILFPFLLCIVGTSSAQTASNRQVATETSPNGNVYMAGRDLTLDQPIAADLIAAGGRVSVERDVGADATIAGGAVDIRAAVAEDLRVAGGSVNIVGNVGADLVAAGGSLTIAEAARVNGPAWMAGGNVNLAGRIANGVRIYAETISLSGQISGNAHLVAQEIIITPNARIEGDLSYSSPDVLNENVRAQVSGTIRRMERPDEWRTNRPDRISLNWFHPVFFLSMLFCGLILYLLFPNAALGAGRTIGHHPWRSLLVGLALIFTVPPVAVLFIITVIGLPIGVALIMVYPLALLLGYLGTAFFLSRKIAIALKQTVEPPSWKRQALFLALALLLLGVAIAVPFIGFLVLLLAVVFGLGGWAAWTQSEYTSHQGRRDAEAEDAKAPKRG